MTQHISTTASVPGSINDPFYECKLGWTGPYCSETTNPSSFNSKSFVKYVLSFTPDHFKTLIQLRFRTRQPDGELFRISDDRTGEYCVLSIESGYLHLKYNLNAKIFDEKDLWLSAIEVNDGDWHSVSAERYGSTAILILDGGHYPRYNETMTFTGNMLMSVDKLEGIYAGGKVEYIGIRQYEVNNDFSGMSTKVRYYPNSCEILNHPFYRILCLKFILKIFGNFCTRILGWM